MVAVAVAGYRGIGLRVGEGWLMSEEDGLAGLGCVFANEERRGSKSSSTSTASTGFGGCW